MHFREFVQMVREECQKNHVGGMVERPEYIITARELAEYTIPKGMDCSVCLDEDGNISKEHTNICVAFSVLPKAGGHQEIWQ